MLAVASGASAAYSTLLFRTTAGAEHSIAVDALQVSFSDGLLTAANQQTSIQLPLAQVASMEFTGNDGSGIADIRAAHSNEPVTVYLLSGVKCAEFPSLAAALNQLEAGTFIVKFSDGATLKISKK